MSMKLHFITLILLLSGCFSGIVSAADIYWTGNGGNDLWDTTANWDLVREPNWSDDVYIDDTSVRIPLIDSTVNAVCYKLNVSSTSGTAQLDITGGTLTVNDNLSIGSTSGSFGLINISGGDIYIEYRFMVGGIGTGTVNMTGGILEVDSELLSVQSMVAAHFQFDGGMIISGGLVMNSTVECSFDIVDGVLVLEGDKVSSINSYVSDGMFTGSGSDDPNTVFIVYDGMDTTVTSNVTEQASFPYPGHGVVNVIFDADMHWKIGKGTHSHDVYFGTDPNDVNNALSSTSGIYMGNQSYDANTFDPGFMRTGQTYYWRIDEINELPEPDIITKGKVWQFTVAEAFAWYNSGDIDMDRDVDVYDLDALLEEWLNEGQDLAGDLDFDDDVDNGDFQIIAKNFGKTAFVFVDNFDDGEFSDWTVVDEGIIDYPSDWQVSAGKLVQSSAIHGPNEYALDDRKGTFVYYNNPLTKLLTDYSLDMTVKTSDTQGIGVIFRYEDQDNYYKFEMDDEDHFYRLTKLVNGEETELAESYANYNQNVDISVKIDVIGNEIEVRVNDSYLFGGTVYDSDLENGSFGFYSWNNMGSIFDDFTVIVYQSAPMLAVTDVYSTKVNTELNVASVSEGVLYNDLHEKDNPMTATLLGGAQHGNVNMNLDGTFTYAPTGNYEGPDYFTYQLTESP